MLGIRPTAKPRAPPIAILIAIYLKMNYSLVENFANDRML